MDINHKAEKNKLDQNKAPINTKIYKKRYGTYVHFSSPQLPFAN